MPTYQYACTTCAEQLEVVQRFTDNPLTLCPACGGALRKVFSPVGIVFKGSGFYRTDSRQGSVPADGNGARDKVNGSDSSPAEKGSPAAAGSSGNGSAPADGKTVKKAAGTGGTSSSQLAGASSATS